MTKFLRTNQDTCINQKPVVKEGQRFKKNDVLVDGCATDGGELALGRNILVAFMPWRGYNFEDAIIVSERIVSEDVFTSVHIEEFELQVRDTKRGEEELTREIPNVSQEATKDLDDNGVIRIGAEVNKGDILIGKITPKGETDPTPEEKLLKAIFGEKAGDVKDASLKAPPGMKGIVISTKLFSRKKKDTESKKEDKKKLESLERSRRKEMKNMQEKLGYKLDPVPRQAKNQSVFETQDGEIVIRAGVVFKDDTFQKMENLEKIDFNQEWIDDKSKLYTVVRIFENFHQKMTRSKNYIATKKIKFNLAMNSRRELFS